MLAIDTETTGLDFWHGCRPFYVSTCDEEGSQRCWEWDVDPVTRSVDVPESDREEIQDLIRSAERLILQNPKFDVHALKSVGIVDFPWDRTEDTLIAGHLLSSNTPHDLTSMVLRYLGAWGLDIKPYEDRLKDAVQEARRHVRKKEFLKRHGTWRIGRDDDPMLPSGGGWGSDYWLPRAVARAEQYDGDHPWWTVLKEYADADTSSTLLLWRELSTEIDNRKLGKIYRERMRVLPIAWDMEDRGITINGGRLRELRETFRRESAEASVRCTAIARRLGFELEMPKGAAPNGSLRSFCFDVLKLDKRYGEKGKGVLPSLAKDVIDSYIEDHSEETPAGEFLRTLRDRRKRDSNIAYMDGYERFWVPFVVDGEEIPDWYVLHSRLNPTATDTLRWSSSNPNEQNISKKGLYQGDVKTLRYLFGPAPGREWWSLDAKNMELRIPGYESGEQDLIDLFERPDEPPFYGSEHLLNFSVVYPEIWERELAVVGIEKVGPHVKKKYETAQYHWVKCGGFAMGYGAVDNSNGTGTADRAFRRPGSQARLKSRFSKKEQLNQLYIRQAQKLGYVETIPDRSVDPDRGYPLMCFRNDYGWVKPTVPLNYHVQSTAMWWTMRAMIRVHAKLAEWRETDGFDGHVTMQVHDELVLDLPARGAPVEDVERSREGRPPRRRSNLAKVRAIQRLMEQGGTDIGVRTPTGCEYHRDNWSEGVTL